MHEVFSIFRHTLFREAHWPFADQLNLRELASQAASQRCSTAHYVRCPLQSTGLRSCRALDEQGGFFGESGLPKRFKRPWAESFPAAPPLATGATPSDWGEKLVAYEKLALANDHSHNRNVMLALRCQRSR